MGLFDLFSGPTVECPRCLGKGEVDWDDIKRLKQDLRWNPGKCAYCNGSGKATQKVVSKIPVDTGFLTSDLSAFHRKKLIDGDPIMQLYGAEQEARISDFISQVEYLYFSGNLDANQITDFFLIANPKHAATERLALLGYVERTIQHKKEQ